MPAKTKARRKFNFQPNEKLFKAMRAYKGKWVVVREDEILLAGEDPLELQRQARKRRLEYDVIDFVPEEEDEPPLIL